MNSFYDTFLDFTPVRALLRFRIMVAINIDRSRVIALMKM